MEEREQKAVEFFRSGMNCSQSVLLAFSGELGIDSETAKAVSCGFGAGMGKLQETCGAVTGAFMVLGFDSYRKFSENSERKERAYNAVRAFSDAFRNLHGTLRCRELIRFDLRTEEGMKEIRGNNLFEVVCEKCVTDSVRITSRIMDQG